MLVFAVCLVNILCQPERFRDEHRTHDKALYNCPLYFTSIRIAVQSSCVVESGLCDVKDTLTYLLDHLKRVAVRADVNKMTSLNVAVCFGPAVVCPSPHADVDVHATDKLDKHVDLLKYMLDIWPETRGDCSLQRRISSN